MQFILSGYVYLEVLWGAYFNKGKLKHVRLFYHVNHSSAFMGSVVKDERTALYGLNFLLLFLFLFLARDGEGINFLNIKVRPHVH